MVFPITVACVVCTVKLLAVVGVGVGAVVGALVVVPPQRLVAITSTRPRTMSQACFGKILIRVLLRKQGGSLVSSTPGVCDEVVQTRYIHNDVAHESGRTFALLQVIRLEVTQASRQAPEQSDHQGARETVLPNFLLFHGMPHLAHLILPFELGEHVQIAHQDGLPKSERLHAASLCLSSWIVSWSTSFSSHRNMRGWVT